MKPYYEADGVTIFHGECLEVLWALGRVDAVVTDPPYNVGVNYGPGAAADNRSPEEHDEDLAAVFRSCDTSEVIWFPGKVNVFRSGAVCELAGLRPHWLLGWHRKEFAGDRWLGGPAISWEPVVWATRSEKPAYQKTFGHMGRDFLVVNSTHGCEVDHPCPKPLRVMRWLVGLFVPPSGLVLDPYAGSGTTLLAAKELGRRAIGIEREERHCETAVRRLSQRVLDLQPGEAAS